MTEETLFKSEQKMSKSEIAEYIRKIADKLDSDQEISLKSGSQSINIKPGSNPELEVKIERESSRSGGETSLELEIEWNDGSSDSLEID
jgi:amphi-Trp domain-containing protein